MPPAIYTMKPFSPFSFFFAIKPRSFNAASAVSRLLPENAILNLRGSTHESGSAIIRPVSALMYGETLNASSLMLNACRCLQGIDLHPAYGIVLFSLLHGLILGLVAEFDLYISVHGMAAWVMMAGAEAVFASGAGGVCGSRETCSAAAASEERSFSG